MNFQDHLDIINNHASELAEAFRGAKPGDVGVVTKTGMSQGSGVSFAEVTFSCLPRDVVADTLENVDANGAKLVIDDLRSGRVFTPGMIPVVVVFDSRVSLSLVSPSMFNV
jgi:hypothetical protein